MFFIGFESYFSVSDRWVNKIKRSWMIDCSSVCPIISVLEEIFDFS